MAVPVSNYTTEFNKKWTTRLNSAQAAGANMPKILQVMRQDWQRVSTGSQPWSDVEAGIATRAALTGKPLISQAPAHKSGIFGELENVASGALGDVKSIAEGLIPGNLWHTAYMQAQGVIRDPAELTRPIEELGQGQFTKAFDDAMKTPLALVPGMYTAQTLAHGNFEDFINHPLMHALDVLPYANAAGKFAEMGALTAEQEAAATASKMSTVGKRILQAGSAEEALKQGKALKAGFRAIGGKVKDPSKIRNPANVAFAEAGKPVWRTSDLVGAIAGHYGFSSADRRLSELANQLDRRITIAGTSVSHTVGGVLKKLSEADRVKVLDQAQHYNPATIQAAVDAGEVSPEVAAATKAIHDVYDDLVKQQVQAGDAVMIPIGGKMLAFDKKSPITKAYSKLQPLNEKYLEASKRLESLHSAADSAGDEVTKRRIGHQIDEAQKEADAAFFEKNKAAQKFQDSLAKDAPKGFDTMQKDRVIKGLMDKILGKETAGTITPEEAGEALLQMTKHNYETLVESGMLSADEVKAVITDVQSGWKDLVDQGYDPVFIPSTPKKITSRMEPKAGTGSIYGKSELARLNPKSLKFEAEAENVGMGLAAGAMEIMRKQATETFYKELGTVATKKSDLLQRYGENFEDDWSPLTSVTKGQKLEGADELYIPRTMKKNVEAMMGAVGKISNVVDKATGVYKFAVLTGPRHIAHVFFSNLMFMMLDEGPFPLMKAKAALTMIRDGKVPWDIPRGQMYFNPEFHADVAASYGGGSSLGRLVKQAWQSKANPVEAAKHFEETMQDMYRIMTYLYEFDKKKHKGFADSVAHDAALGKMNKVYMDVDAMTPIEQNAIRVVFPFYNFTKHTLRYMLNFAADHPMRAATLAALIRQESRTQQSGLPGIFNNLFFLGGPDKNGNQSVIDMRSTNPFRGLDGQNPFTLAGFMGALNPAIQAPFVAAGFQPLKGMGELYPELKYDPHTGGITAEHPDAAAEVLGTFVPPFEAINAVMSRTKEWASLKQANPNAYATAIGSALNLPFGVNPITGLEKVNVQQKRTSDQLNLYKVAQQKMQDAMKSGDTASLEDYNLIPYQGTLITNEQAINLVNFLKKAAGGAAPGSVAPRSKKVALQLVQNLTPTG